MKDGQRSVKKGIGIKKQIQGGRYPVEMGHVVQAAGDY